VSVLLVVTESTIRNTYPLTFSSMISSQDIAPINKESEANGRTKRSNSALVNRDASPAIKEPTCSICNDGTRFCTSFGSLCQGHTQAHEGDLFGDRERTELRYKNAISQLEESLRFRRQNWEIFQIPNLDLRDNDTLPKLRQEIKKTLDARQKSIRNQNSWSKGKNLVERIFIAMSPFAKSFLTVAKDGQQAFSFFNLLLIVL
jgi:hypothetical protein